MRPTTVVSTVSGAPKFVVLRALKGLGRPMTLLRDGCRGEGDLGAAVATKRTVCDIIR